MSLLIGNLTVVHNHYRLYMEYENRYILHYQIHRRSQQQRHFLMILDTNRVLHCSKYHHYKNHKYKIYLVQGKTEYYVHMYQNQMYKDHMTKWLY